MVVADEIHDSLSPMYFNFFKNNQYKHLIGLSATIDGQTKYDIDGQEVSKTDMLDRIAPIVFRYSVNDGQKDDTSRKLFIFVIDHELDNHNKYVEKTFVDKKTKEKKTFFVSELEGYTYAHQRFLEQIYSRSKSPWLINYWASQRANILYKSESKNNIIKELLQFIDRTLIFGNSIPTLEKICPVISSYNSKEENADLLRLFNSGWCNTIGSFKMLKQGITLHDLDNIIMHSYYKIEKDWIQRVGRLRKTDKPGFVFILRTVRTQEEKWFKTMMQNINGFPIINCNRDNLIQKLNEVRYAHI